MIMFFKIVTPYLRTVLFTLFTTLFSIQDLPILILILGNNLHVDFIWLRLWILDSIQLPSVQQVLSTVVYGNINVDTSLHLCLLKPFRLLKVD